MKFTVKDIALDKPNRNGKIYSKEAVKKAIDEYNQQEIRVGEIEPEQNKIAVQLNNVGCKINNTRIKDDKLECDIEIIDERLEDISPEDLEVRMRGLGNINENQEVENLHIVSFDVFCKDEG